MISFNNLGKMGRLGNQMFQYAALKGIAHHKGYWYSIPEQNDLKSVFKLPSTLSNNNVTSLQVDRIFFDQNLFDYCPDDIDLVGYFQTEKYFQHIDKEIRQDFTFHDRIEKISSQYRNSVFPKIDLISMHIRRTDYLSDSNFTSLSLEYYEHALSLLPKVPVIIFSDDPSWCKHNFKDRRFTVSVSNNQGIDLCLMSLCNYHIIANSSFSWWGSWLSKSKKTIAPKDWFSGQLSNWDTKDLYLPEWTTI